MKKSIEKIAIIMFVIIVSSCAKNGWKQQQKSLSWENYQSNYKTEMIKNAREIGRERKQAEKDSIERVKFFEKIERLKGNGK